MPDLHFHGPFPLLGPSGDVLSECPCQTEAGIYLWAVQQLTGSYRISYIGETEKSFHDRMKEHIIQTLGGNYRICEADPLRQGIQRIVWDGLWRRGTRHRTLEFFYRYEELAPLVKQHLLWQSIFLAPWKGEVRLRRRIEGALALHLRADGEASSLLPDDIRFAVRRRGEKPVSVIFHIDSRIEGFPQQLEV